MSAGKAIVFDGVRKSFGSRTILDSVTFEVDCGRSVSILGRSGTGKSVTLKLMIGLLTPDAGLVEVLGEEPSKLDAEGLSALRRRMGFLFQNSAQAAIEKSITWDSFDTRLINQNGFIRSTGIIVSVGHDMNLGVIKRVQFNSL